MTFHSESIDRLYQAIATLETKEECRMFFEDICTIKEIKEMSVEKAVMIIDKGLDCSKCIYHSEVDGMITLSHECKMKHHIETCKEGIKAYLESEEE